MEWIELRPTRPGRRVKILRIDQQVFIHLLSPNGKHLRRQQGMPPDANVIGIRYEPEFGVVAFVIQSEEFEPVSINQKVPPLEVTYEETYHAPR